MKAKEKIIGAYLEEKKKQLYFNELKELTKLSNSSLQNSLEKLITGKYVNSKKTKAHVFFEIKNNLLFAIDFAKISLQKFLNLNRGVRIPLTNFLEKYPKNTDIIVLFGSASRKKEKEGSDIDILVVSPGKNNIDLLKKEIESISNYPLSIFTCTYKEFLSNTDHVIIQAKQTGFPIKGHQQFYEVILNEFD